MNTTTVPVMPTSNAYAQASKAWETLRRNIAQLADSADPEIREVSVNLLRDLRVALLQESMHMVECGAIAEAESQGEMAGKMVAVGYRASSCFLVTESAHADSLRRTIVRELEELKAEHPHGSDCSQCVGSGGGSGALACSGCHGSGVNRAR